MFCPKSLNLARRLQAPESTATVAVRTVLVVAAMLLTIRHQLPSLAIRGRRLRSQMEHNVEVFVDFSLQIEHGLDAGVD